MSMTFISSISAETYTVQTGDSLSTIAKKFYGDDSEVKEEIYRVLADIAYGGTALPHPMQFGLG